MNDNLPFESSSLNEKIDFVFNQPHFIASRQYYNQEIRLFKVTDMFFAEVWYVADGSGIHKVEFIEKPNLALYV